MASLVFTPAHRLAQMIKERSVSSLEVVEAYLTQIEQHNPAVKAICTLDADNARARARQADKALAAGELWGALHGVPVTVKDFYETAGIRTTAGYKPLQNYVPTQNATVVSRLLSAGAILLGKTNLSNLTYQSSNDVFPRTNNPWNLDYTPGGTSSGSAAAIAAGFSALDVGSDFAGSIRQPAHCCGIYGLKPTDGRVSSAGDLLEVPGSPHCIRQMLVPGPMARSVEDLKLCFSLIAGSDSRRPDIPPVPLDEPKKKPLAELRLAWSDSFRVPVANDIQKALRHCVGQLTESGAFVENWAPSDFDWTAVQKLYYRLASHICRYTQPTDFDRVQKQLNFIWQSSTQGDSQLRKAGTPAQVMKEVFAPTLKSYFENLTERDLVIAQLDQLLEPWDAWLIPVAATAAFTHRPDWKPIKIDGVSYPNAIANGAYTMPLNLSSHPVVVIPIGQTQEGLPIGMQIVGKRWREMELLEISQQIDEVVNAFQSPPGY